MKEIIYNEDRIKDEEVEIYIICESLVDGASIELSRPVLIDLKHQKKSYKQIFFYRIIQARKEE